MCCSNTSLVISLPTSRGRHADTQISAVLVEATGPETIRAELQSADVEMPIKADLLVSERAVTDPFPERLWCLSIYP